MDPMHVMAGYTDSAVGLDAHVRVAHAWGTSCWTCSGPGWSGLAASPCLLAIEGDPHHMTSSPE